jgi:phosphatidylserine synthase
MESAVIGLIPHATSAKHLVKRADVYPSTMLENLPRNIKTRYIVMLAMFAVAIVYYLFIYPLLIDAPKTLALSAQFAYVAACIALFYLFVIPVLANPTFSKPDHP